MRALLDVALVALDLYQWVVILAVALSWLYAFGVVNPANRFVATIANVLHQMTEPILRYIRRVVPSFGTIDVSPLVLLLGIFFVRQAIIYYLYPTVARLGY